MDMDSTNSSPGSVPHDALDTEDSPSNTDHPSSSLPAVNFVLHPLATMPRASSVGAIGGGSQLSSAAGSAPGFHDSGPPVAAAHLQDYPGGPYDGFPTLAAWKASLPQSEPTEPQPVQNPPSIQEATGNTGHRATTENLQRLQDRRNRKPARGKAWLAERKKMGSLLADMRGLDLDSQKAEKRHASQLKQMDRAADSLASSLDTLGLNEQKQREISKAQQKERTHIKHVTGILEDQMRAAKRRNMTLEEYLAKVSNRKAFRAVQRALRKEKQEREKKELQLEADELVQSSRMGTADGQQRPPQQRSKPADDTKARRWMCRRLELMAKQEAARAARLRRDNDRNKLEDMVESQAQLEDVPPKQPFDLETELKSALQAWPAYHQPK